MIRSIFATGVARTTFSRSARFHTPIRIAALAINKPRPTIFVRSVASTVSNKPASQTFDHAALNIREEAGNTAADVAKSIAGGSHIPASDHSFVAITSSLASSVPKPVMVFGLLGTIPYVGAGATTVYLASVAGAAAAGHPTSIDPGVALTMLDQSLNIQVTYGAIMLSFLGALHWGMEFASPLPTQSQSIRRLLLGAAPLFLAWPTLGLQPMTALVVQWVGFTGLWWADATREGTVPGVVEAVPADAKDGAYVVLRKRDLTKEVQQQQEREREKEVKEGVEEVKKAKREQKK
ncbi:mnn4-regulates the mannosylphosphorylation [Lentinula edodes]|uniref:Mnn4-regulates the mannosylphosphorylation n=1 Tax=Lentinula edodes TaxID=5353 RepID=A0A1Q3E6V1_LENED|nr:mnn4-regulates the mannosylphosphorylation [Lentinula edodes]